MAFTIPDLHPTAASQNFTCFLSSYDELKVTGAENILDGRRLKQIVTENLVLVEVSLWKRFQELSVKQKQSHGNVVLYGSRLHFLSSKRKLKNPESVKITDVTHLDGTEITDSNDCRLPPRQLWCLLRGINLQTSSQHLGNRPHTGSQTAEIPFVLSVSSSSSANFSPALSAGVRYTLNQPVMLMMHVTYIHIYICIYMKLLRYCNCSCWMFMVSEGWCTNNLPTQRPLLRLLRSRTH